MTKATAKTTAKALKAAKAKAADAGITEYEHASTQALASSDPEADQQARTDAAADADSQTTGEEGVDTPVEPVVQSGFSVFNQPGTTMTETTKTKQELDAEKAQAKIAAKEAKAKADADKKAAAQAEREAKIKARDELMTKRKAEREAAIEKAKAEKAEKAPRERTYVGSMLALSDRVKAGTYVKGINGQLRSNDEVAVALESVPAKRMVQLLLAVFGLTENPYAHLNYGQQSMNLRNKLRGGIRQGLEVGPEGAKVKLSVDYLKQVRDAGNYTAEAPVEPATA